MRDGVNNSKGVKASMSNQLKVFAAREFRDDDRVQFNSAIEGLIGQRCVLCQKGYRRMVSLHFGRLVERLDPPPGAVGQKHGTWVIDLWDCDALLKMRDGQVDSRIESEQSFHEKVSILTDDEITGIKVQMDLSLSIQFGTGTLLELLVDPDGRADSEQWAIELPRRRAISAYGERYWSVQQK